MKSAAVDVLESQNTSDFDDKMENYEPIIPGIKEFIKEYAKDILFLAPTSLPQIHEYATTNSLSALDVHPKMRPYRPIRTNHMGVDVPGLKTFKTDEVKGIREVEPPPPAALASAPASAGWTVFVKATGFASNIKAAVIGPGTTHDDFKEILKAQGMPHTDSLRFCRPSGPWLNDETPLSEQGVTSMTTVNVMLVLRGGVDDEAICAICIQPMSGESGETVVACEGPHTFHLDCIAGWMRQSKTACPTCRRPMLQALVDEHVPKHHAVFDLIERGASLDEIDALIHSDEVNLGITNESGTCLIAVAARHGRLDLERSLLEIDDNDEIDLDHQDHLGNTAIISASIHGHADCVIELASMSADLDHRNDNGSTALIVASLNGHEDCVRELLDWGANVEIRDSDDESALDVARSNGHHAIARILQRALHHADVKRKAEEVVQEQIDDAIEAHRERLEQARAALESVDAASHASLETMRAEVRKLERELDELEELPLNFDEYEGDMMLLEEYELFGIEYYLDTFDQCYEEDEGENFDADAFVQQWVPTRDVDMGPPPDDDNDGDNNDDALGAAAASSDNGSAN